MAIELAEKVTAKRRGDLEQLAQEGSGGNGTRGAAGKDVGVHVGKAPDNPEGVSGADLLLYGGNCWGEARVRQFRFDEEPRAAVLRDEEVNLFLLRKKYRSPRKKTPLACKHVGERIPVSETENTKITPQENG